MIVLDEQLLGRRLEAEIGRWYPGSVQFITDSRPGTVIKDDAICVALPDPRADEIPELLRSLFRHPGFAAKSDRMGKVVRLTTEGGSYYATDRNVIEISKV